MRNPPALLTAAILLATACGGDGNGDTVRSDPGPVDATVEVAALDIDFQPDDLAAEAGTVQVVLDNEGSIRHTLVIEEVEGFKLEVDSNGDTDAGAVELGPGTYEVYCDVPGHRAGGMVATLTIQ